MPFLGPSDDEKTARAVILPVPYDATTSFHAGARHAPDAVMRASYHIEDYDEELGRVPAEIGIHTAPAVEPNLAGPEPMVERIRAACRAWLERDKFVLTLGGDHTVTVGTGWAHADHYGELTFLQIDAHADMRDSYEGSRFSHACAARRLSERGRVVQVGIRSISVPEVRHLEAIGERPLYAYEIAARPGDWWIDEAIERLGERVYVTFDVDGLDPAVMPATGTPEPGGLTYVQALRLLRRVAEARRVVGADICELLPTAGLHACDVTVARLAYKMLGYFVR